MTGKEIDVRNEYDRKELEQIHTSYTPDQLIAIAGAVARGAAGRAPSVGELQLLAFVQQSTQLDWFKGELGMARWSSNDDAPLEPYISYEGYFTLAARDVPLIGHEMYWCGSDGVWMDLWLDDEWGAPKASKCVLWIKDNPHPVVATASWGAWARGELVDEEIPDPAGGFMEKRFDEWSNVTDANGKIVYHESGPRKGKPKRQSKTVTKKVPATVTTGRKVIAAKPGSIWHDRKSFAIGKQALKLAAKSARRMTGRPEALPPADIGGIAKLRQVAWALLRELGREKDEAFRHELSEGVSWSDNGGLDVEDWVRIIADLQVKVELKRIADGQPRLSDDEKRELFASVNDDLRPALQASIKATSKDVQGSPVGAGSREAEVSDDAESPTQTSPPESPADVDPPESGRSDQGTAEPGPGSGGVPTTDDEERASEDQINKVLDLAAALDVTPPPEATLTPERADRLIRRWTQELESKEGKRS